MFALLKAVFFSENVRECSYIRCNSVAEWCDEAQASVTQDDSKAVQSHTVLHTTDVCSLQLQGRTTCAALMGKRVSPLFF